MVKLLGSSESLASGAACCDVCSGRVVPSSTLDIFVPTTMKRPRKPKAVRVISPNMADAVKMALEQERRDLLERFPGYKMIGGSFILSEKTIDELCALAPPIRYVEDLNGVVTLQP